MSIQIQEKDIEKIGKISESILKSMLKRGFPAVDATYFFKEYTINGKPDHQFLHALTMMTQGGLIRIDKETKPFSVTFVLLEDNKPKMHHMIDDDWNSKTFGCMINDPYEGPKKHQTCYKHLENGYTQNCEKCELERITQVCMLHDRVLSDCKQCQKISQELKKGISEKDKDIVISTILKEHKKKFWSFGN